MKTTYGLVVALAILGLAAAADAKPNKLFKETGGDGIPTYKDRGVVGNAIFSRDKIGRTDPAPKNQITEIAIPDDPEDLQFYVRMYAPDNFKTLIRSIGNKSKNHHAEFEVWIGGGGPNKVIEIDGDLGSVGTWDSLMVDVNHVKSLADLPPGKHNLVMWMVMTFDELQPHPDTGVARFVPERMYLAMGTLQVIKR